MTVCQPPDVQLTLRNREQAPSHRERAANKICFFLQKDRTPTGVQVLTA